MKPVVMARSTTQQEKAEQMALFNMVYLYEDRFPLLKTVYHCPNGEWRHPKTAVELKAMGVRRGVPDVHIPVRRELGNYTEAWIEMKVYGGRVEPEQAAWHTHLRDQGAYVRVCWTWMEAWLTICWYLGIRVNEDGAPLP